MKDKIKSQPNLLIVLSFILSFLMTSYIITWNDAFADGSINDRKNEDQLSEDEILIEELPSPGENGRTFEATTVFNAKLPDIYSVLIGFEDYDKFMPNVSKVEVLDRNDSSAVMNYYLDLPLGNSRKYRLKMEFKNSGDSATLKWEMIEWPGLAGEDTIQDTNGYWMLKNSSVRDGYVDVLYHVYTDPGRIPLGLGWIIDILTEKSVPDVLRKTRSHVYDLYK